jgi:hypothetical protein
MSTEIYRYTFTPTASSDDIEATLVLAILATDALHGEVQVRLDAAHFYDPEQRVCVIDAGTKVGRDFNRLFAGFIRHEFGEDAFEVQRVGAVPQTSPVASASTS